MRMAKRLTALAFMLLGAYGCATPYAPPAWKANSPVAEAEYTHYLKAGSGILRGQAFLTQSGGGVVKGAGRTVTLDPATSTGIDWWEKAGKFWLHQASQPPSKGFEEARRTAVADADGRFTFTDLPAGKYFVRTSVTWEIGNYNPTQGGLVGKAVTISDGKTTEVVLNAYPQ